MAACVCSLMCVHGKYVRAYAHTYMQTYMFIRTYLRTYVCSLSGTTKKRVRQEKEGNGVVQAFTG